MTPKLEANNPQRPTGVAVQRVVRAPEWVLDRDKITQRQWRIRKRKDLKALIAAMKNYRTGCAYCPSQNGEVGALGRLLESMWESHKEKNWPWRSNAGADAPATDDKQTL